MPWKCAVALLTAILATTAWTQQTDRPSNQSPGNSTLPAVEPPNRPVIGLALEGGSALGLSHLGVIQWLEEHHIPIDRVAGTSMGALVAALYASGHTPAEMRELALSDAFTRVFTLETPYVDSSFRRRQDRRENPVAITVGLRHHLALRNALLSDRGVNEFLTTNLLPYDRLELDFNRLPIPFRCVATDLNTLQSVTFSTGPIAKAVRASISLPGVFPPVQDASGHYLIDGGILDNLPTDVVKRDLHADAIIAVHFEDAALSEDDTSSIVSVLNRAFDAAIEHNVAQSELLTDVVITVPVGGFSVASYNKGVALIKTGYQAAEQNRTALLRYALDDRGWNAYLAAREGRRAPEPGKLLQVHVEGGESGARSQVMSDLKALVGKPVEAAATLNALKNIQSDGGYTATYDTFSPETAAASRADSTPDTGILVRLSNDRIGPPFLMIGSELATATSNITRMAVNLRLVDQNLGGFGSELRAGVQLGYKTDAFAEYHRHLTPSGFFMEPRVSVLREPVYIWANQKRIAERLQQDLVAGMEVGRTFSNTMQISAEWRAEDTHWSLRTGSGGGPYLAGTAQTGLLHFNLDKESSGTISPQGFRIAASAGALYHAAGSANAPLINLSFSRTRVWKETNILELSAEINSYLRTNVAQPFRFTLGGPRRLSASSFDEYRGTDTYLTRLGYLRRLAALPTGLGQGLYGVIGYEAGEVWSPEQRAILRQDGALGLAAATPLGAVSLGFSVGDAGHRKVFFTIGKMF
jgi:NTE family protein